MRPVYRLALIALLLPAGGVFAASKEMQEMQRDIAQLQDQVRSLQSSFDQKMTAIQTLLQQALDAGNKANIGVAVLSSTVSQTLDHELSSKLAPIASETQRLLQDHTALDAILRDGAAKAAAIAEPIVSEAERLVGFLKV